MNPIHDSIQNLAVASPRVAPTARHHAAGENRRRGRPVRPRPAVPAQNQADRPRAGSISPSSAARARVRAKILASAPSNSRPRVQSALPVM